MALFIYGVASNYGKDFFTAQDRQNFFLRGFPGDVWVIGATEKGALWLAERGVEKTKAEAQALVDAAITQAQSDWDDLPSDNPNKKGYNTRPESITITE